MTTWVPWVTGSSVSGFLNYVDRWTGTHLILDGFNPGMQPRGTPITAEVVQGGDVDINVIWRDAQGRVASSSWSKSSGWDLPDSDGGRAPEDGRGWGHYYCLAYIALGSISSAQVLVLSLCSVPISKASSILFFLAHLLFALVSGYLPLFSIRCSACVSLLVPCTHGLFVAWRIALYSIYLYSKIRCVVICSVC